MVCGRRSTRPKRCSTAATIKSRTSSPPIPPVVATKLIASRSQQSRAKATRTRSPFAPDLKGIRAPAQIRPCDGDLPIVTALDPACMPLKQEAMLLHHAVDPLVVRGLTLPGHGAAAQDGMHPAI